MDIIKILIGGLNTRSLRKLRATSADRFAAGGVMYAGETTAGFGENSYAAPIRAIWETSQLPIFSSFYPIIASTAHGTALKTITMIL
ncbi:MAG: hypothetical protein R6V60_12090 [Desulfobacterales bacterium]